MPDIFIVIRLTMKEKADWKVGNYCPYFVLKTKWPNINCLVISLWILSSIHFKWSRRESNSYLKFRKLLFYPLNYGTSPYNRAAKVQSQIRNQKYIPVTYLCTQFYRLWSGWTLSLSIVYGWAAFFLPWQFLPILKLVFGLRLYCIW